MLMVCEDDVQFVGQATQVNAAIMDFAHNSNLDVLALGFSLRSQPIAVSQFLSITNDTQTTSCYVLKRQALSSIIDDFSASTLMLSRGAPERRAALDIVWKRSQQNSLVFAIPNERLVIQRQSFSDILNSDANYGV